MYDPGIVERRLHAVKQKGLTYQRVPRSVSIEVASNLELLRYGPDGRKLPEGQLSRALNEEEQKFIASERLLCRASFEYFFLRYYQMVRDAGVGVEEGIGPVALLESQAQFIKKLGQREAEVHEEFAKYGMTEGIRALAHKCRQVGLTAVCRAIALQRMLLWPGTRAFMGALNPDGVGDAYKRDMIAIDNLPFWLLPEVYPNVKDSEIGFPDPLNSRLIYQPENQRAGIGVGQTFEVSHLTEVSLWEYPYQIGFSFAPSLPKSRMTIHIQEATSSPYPYWQEVTEACRKKERGYENWTYVFIPYYFNRNKWRSIPTVDWEPDKHTLDHAALVERTSPEWCNGKTVRPSREQLYWWETERSKYAKEGRLAAFLSNWPATPEQSFTNWSEGALPVEVIEKMELTVRDPMVYEVEAHV